MSMPITQGELWLQGSADNQQAALARAIMNAPEISSRPGEKVIVMIDTIWEDEEGQFHAKVCFRKLPEATAKKMMQPAQAANGPTEPGHDELLENPPEMEEAEEKMEHDFDEATEGQPQNAAHKAKARETAEEYRRRKEKARKTVQPVPEPEGTAEEAH